MPADTVCRVGQPLPSFDIHAVAPSGQIVRLSSDAYRGQWWVLLFYPRNFSFVCPTELIAFSAQMEAFQARDCQLVGVSIDTLESHRAALNTEAGEGGVPGLQFPLAADTEGTLARLFGAWREAEQMPSRGLFLIDPQGVLRHATINDLAVGRDPDETLRVLDGLRAGGLCPATWKRADGVLDVKALLKPGRVLGHYMIEQVLGRGRFGLVLRAQDQRLHRTVALKIITATQANAEEELLSEARAAAAVEHPNLVTIYSVDMIDHLPTIVMPYVDGVTLHRRLESDRPLADPHEVLTQISDAVAAAHDNQVVHGDLKPANILLEAESHPIVIDFGLSSLAGPRSQQPLSSPELERPAGSLSETWVLDPDATHAELRGTAKTETGPPLQTTISGTPAYLAPEIIQGVRPSRSADVFALGLIFVEVLSGRRLLAAKPVAEVLRSLGSRSFVERIPQHVPPPYRELCARMLHFDPAQRCQAAEIAQAMEAA